MDMRRVLCLVLLIALGEAAVRYPRGYSLEGDLQYSGKDKKEAYYAFNAGDVTKGGKHIKGSELSSNIDAAYELLNKKENEIYNNEEPKVDLDSIAVKDVEHSITVESNNNIGSIALSRDSSIVSLPTSVLDSSYSSNSDHSIDVKSSNNVPSDSIIESDNNSKKGDINRSNSGSSSYGHSGIIIDKNNCKNGHGTHHQTNDKGLSHYHGHVIPHKHSEESSESSESSEESNESKDSHSREHEHDFKDSLENSYQHHKNGHKITKRSSERISVNLKKSETKHKDQRKVEEGINANVKDQRIKRSGEYYRYNNGRHSEESGGRYKHGDYRRGHGDSDSDSTSEESSEERNWNKSNAWRTDKVGSWGRRVRRSGGYYFGNGGYHYNSGESSDNSNEGGERGHYNYNRRPGFGFAQGSGESNEGYW